MKNVCPVYDAKWNVVGQTTSVAHKKAAKILKVSSVQWEKGPVGYGWVPARNFWPCCK
jgi:hypothetical protein